MPMSLLLKSLESRVSHGKGLILCKDKSRSHREKNNALDKQQERNSRERVWCERYSQFYDKHSRYTRMNQSFRAKTLKKKCSHNCDSGTFLVK